MNARLVFAREADQQIDRLVLGLWRTTRKPGVVVTRIRGRIRITQHGRNLGVHEERKLEPREHRQGVAKMLLCYVLKLVHA